MGCPSCISRTCFWGTLTQAAESYPHELQILAWIAISKPDFPLWSCSLTLLHLSSLLPLELFLSTLKSVGTWRAKYSFDPFKPHLGLTSQTALQSTLWMSWELYKSYPFLWMCGSPLRSKSQEPYTSSATSEMLPDFLHKDTVIYTFMMIYNS